MKKLFLLLALVAFTVSCDPTENDVYTGEIRTLTFEDESGDYWENLIDADEYGGSLLYGEEYWNESYGGYTDYRGNSYSWTDTNTGLTSSTNYDIYWNGGIAISDYLCVIESGVDSENQLSVPATNGSSKFAMANADAVLSFENDAEYTIDHMYIANSSYMLSSCEYGDNYVVGGLTSTDWVTVTVTAADADGNEVGSLTYYLAKNGKPVEGWKKWDLSVLGDVNSLTFSFTSSNGYESYGEYYSNVPGYLAIDDIAVRFE